MNLAAWMERVDELGDVLALQPEFVRRFYRDGGRLGQGAGPDQPPGAGTPERWIGSTTRAVNPDTLPPGGLSRCSEIIHEDQPVTLRDLLRDDLVGARLLGESRFAAHNGEFRVLTKVLDAGIPIPFHVHADDAFVAGHPDVFTDERFGKTEAYYFLEAPKGACPFTHVGLHAGIDASQLIAAMEKGGDYVLELSPATPQNFGRAMIVHAGLLHRPGTALTLEVQQPSDVYTLFQLDFGGVPQPPDVRHRGFATARDAADAVVNWQANQRKQLIESLMLEPAPVYAMTGAGGRADWIIPPTASDKFSAMRLDIETQMSFTADDPCVLFVWEGEGTCGERVITGRRGAAGGGDELFVGHGAAKRGIELTSTGEGSLTVFAVFPALVAATARKGQGKSKSKGKARG